ncbi:MAG: hypothetical protein VKK03_06540 [Synechococcus sp.]|nr:hypothetical protein [Synechococcus sp.]
MYKTIFAKLLPGIFLLAATQGHAQAAGEAIGNPINECNTSQGECPTTPTKFSTTVYRIALCNVSPMESPATTVDWDGAGCEDVYNNSSGETTGDIFSASGVNLSAAFTSVPPAGSYNKVVALVSNSFKMATHHEVVAAGSNNSVNSTRYVSTASGGAVAGASGTEQMYSVTVDSFASQLACNGAYVTPNSWSDTGIAGNGFVGRLLNSNMTMPTTGSGLIGNNTATCDDVSYIFVIVDKPVTVSEDALGIDLKIRATKGTAKVNQGSGNGVVTGFSGAGHAFTYDVSTF